MERHHAHPNSIEGNKYSEVKNAERIKKTYNIMVMNFDEDFQD